MKTQNITTLAAAVLLVWAGGACHGQAGGPATSSGNTQPPGGATMKDPNTGQAMGSGSKMTFGPTSGPGTGGSSRNTTRSTHRRTSKSGTTKTYPKKSLAKGNSHTTKIVMTGHQNQNDTTTGNPSGSMN